MSQVEVLTPATDTRLIPPADLMKAINGIDLPQAEDLVDESGEWLTAFLSGRPLHRATYSERLEGAEIGEALRMTRWPVEKDAADDSVQVNLGNDALDAALYYVGELCRNVLRRDPEIAFGHTRSFADPIFPLTSQVVVLDRVRPGAVQDFSVPAFTAGYLLKGQLAVWDATKEWAVGATTSRGGSNYGWAKATAFGTVFRFEVTAATVASTVATEPVWPTAVGESVTAIGVPNDVTFTARYAVELKSTYKTAMIQIADHLKRANKLGKKCDDDEKLLGRIKKMIMGAC